MIYIPLIVVRFYHEVSLSVSFGWQLKYVYEHTHPLVDSYVEVQKTNIIHWPFCTKLLDLPLFSDPIPLTRCF